MDVENQKPIVSVLMSVYNGEAYLVESIQSIVNQTFNNWELVVVNDCSKDETVKILSDFEKNNSKIKVIHNLKNLGLASSLNRAIDHAQGKYMARLDCDDIALPQRLEKQIDFMESRPDIELVGCRAIPISTNSDAPTLHKITFIQNISQALINGENPMVHSSIMFRRGIRYREKFRFAQDVDLYLNLLSQKKRMFNMDEELILFRFHDHSVSSEKRAMQYAFAYEALKQFRQRMETGNDSYDTFEEKKMDVPNFVESDFVSGRVKDLLLRRNKNGARQLIKEFKQKSKLTAELRLLWLLSYSPELIVKMAVWLNDKIISYQYR